MPGTTPSRTTKNCYVPLIPVSERQQLKLVRQLETCDNQGSNSGSVRETGTQRPRSRSCNGRGETPLHKAAIKGDEELVARLLEEGADPNIPDFAGWTPLHEACNHGWYDVALALVQAGASINARGFDDDTPLHDAAINGHSKLVRLLVERGADVFSRNKGGKTPCDVAAPGLVPHLLRTQIPESSEVCGKSDVSGGSAEADDTAISEMRRTPPHTKVDKSSRVTVRLHHIKKKSGKICGEGTLQTSSRFQFSLNMEEKNNKEDVYEFKSSKEATPVRGNSTSPDVDKSNAEAKSEKLNEAFQAAEGESPSTKRNISEVVDNEENEEDGKKKKRKEGENKDGNNSGKATPSTGRMTSVRNVNNNSDKAGKVGNHVVNKSANVGTPKNVPAGNTNTLNSDRKSPSSPKGNGATPSTSTSSNGNGNIKVEIEQEDKASSDGEKVDSGPKVPPLKIVIPQQSGAEPEQGNRNGKSSTSRHQALPYIVSSNSNDSEKDGTRSRSVSPTDSVKSDDKKDPAIGMLSAEDQKVSLHHQRVLRSAHRSGPGSNGESRSSDPPTPRSSSNGSNGQVTSTSTGATATVSTSSTSTTSGATSTTTTPAVAPSTDNPSPQSQSEMSPLPAAEAQVVSTSTPVSTASENPSTSSNGNYSMLRSSAVTNTKPSMTVCTSTVGSASSEEKLGENVTESGASTSQQPSQSSVAVELHPRKRKLKHNKDVKDSPMNQIVSERCDSASTSTEVHPHEQPVKNCYQLFLEIRKQIGRRRKALFPVQPKPPQGFKDYLMNRCTYLVAANMSIRQIPSSSNPQNLPPPMKELFAEQEKERHRLRLRHVIEKEKLVLSVEQEILRVHGRAARALANQSLPFSVCTFLKDEEVYNLITPEQEEKDRNARSRYNGRLFLSWLQDVDDKWEKIKEGMLLRHHNEAESLHAVQKMDWEWKMKEFGLCDFKSKPVIINSHVPMVHVSDDFDLLPA